MPAKVKGGSTKMAAPSSLLVWRSGEKSGLLRGSSLIYVRNFGYRVAGTLRVCVCVCVCNKFSRKVYQRRGFNKKNRSKKYIYRFWTERNVSLDYEKY